eukprot:jgi/Chlat1/5193/Chrsp33S05172
MARERTSTLGARALQRLISLRTTPTALLARAGLNQRLSVPTDSWLSGADHEAFARGFSAHSGDTSRSLHFVAARAAAADRGGAHPSSSEDEQRKSGTKEAQRGGEWTIQQDAERGRAEAATPQPSAGTAVEGQEDTTEDTTEVDLEAVIAALEAALIAKDVQIADLQDKLLRRLAEMENQRTVAEKEMDMERELAVVNFARDIVDVADRLEFTLDDIPEDVKQGNFGKLITDKERQLAQIVRSLVEGLQMTHRRLQQVFELHGIEKFKPNVGDPFDPKWHEADAVARDSLLPDYAISRVILPGYRYRDYLVRPAEVAVVTRSQGPDQA